MPSARTCRITARCFVVCVLLLSSVGCKRGDKVPAGLVGTWQVVSRIDRDASGNVIPERSLGSDPLGYLIYDSKGHMAAQLMAPLIRQYCHGNFRSELKQHRPHRRL